jgi:hypothetical protein
LPAHAKSVAKVVVSAAVTVVVAVVMVAVAVVSAAVATKLLLDFSSRPGFRGGFFFACPSLYYPPHD